MRRIADAQQPGPIPAQQPVHLHREQFDLLPLPQLRNAIAGERRDLPDALAKLLHPALPDLIERSLADDQARLEIIAALDQDQHPAVIDAAEHLVRVVRTAAEAEPEHVDGHAVLAPPAARWSGAHRSPPPDRRGRAPCARPRAPPRPPRARPRGAGPSLRVPCEDRTRETAGLCRKENSENPTAASAPQTGSARARSENPGPRTENRHTRRRPGRCAGAVHARLLRAAPVRQAPRAWKGERYRRGSREKNRRASPAP